MKLTNTFLAFTLLACSLGASAQSSINNPVTRAVLEVYEQELRENPLNYAVLMQRADEYYRHDEYIRALADVDKVLLIVPAAETDIRLRAYVLRAGINGESGRHLQALEDLDKAYELAPDSYNIVYQRANTNFQLGRYSEARQDFNRMLRINPRSAEAHIGLARVAVKENNLGTANEMLANAVTLDPNNAETYVRRASVRKLMGDHNGAVDDLILALSTDNKNNKAMAELVAYGNTNYPAAMAGLTNAIQAAPQVGMFRYLRAMIAQSHYHYLAALSDYKYILDNNIYNYHGIYASMAECEYCLGDYNKALSSVDRALGIVRDNASYFVLKSRILRALGRDDDAIKAAADALAVDRANNDALVEMALAYLAVKNYEEASNLLGEAILNDGANAYYPLLRAWVLGKYLNKEAAAQQLYRKVADLDNFFMDNPKSYKGFALLALGSTREATRWMENLLTTVQDHDGYINYLGACLYAQAGDNDKALQCAAEAMKLGYANYHQWTQAADGTVNVAPLRDDLKFLNLLHRNDAIFGKE